MTSRPSLERFDRVAPYALAMWLLVVVITNVWWLAGTPPAMIGVDSWDFYPASLHYYRYLTGVEEVGFDPVAAIGTYRGPLFHWASMPLPLLVGPSQLAFAVTGTLFAVALLLAVFGIGRRLAGPTAGLLAAVLVGTVPMVVLGSRSYNLEVALAAVVALAVYCLVRGENFTRLAWAPLFGLAAAGAMLVKGVAFLYVLPPLGGAWLQWLVEYRRTDRPRASFGIAVGWTTLALAIGLGVSLLWYRDGFALLRQTIFSQIDAYWDLYAPFATEGGQSVWSQTLRESGPVLLAASLAGVIGLLWRRPPGWGALLCWALVPALGFLSGPADYARFLTATYAAFALAGAVTVVALARWRMWPAAVVTVVLTAGAFWQFAAATGPLRGDFLPVIDTPGHVFVWPDRDRATAALREVVGDGDGATVLVYAGPSGTTLSPKIVYTYLALAMPRARLLASPYDGAMGYRFAKLCEGLETADALLVILAEDRRGPAPGAGTFAPPRPPDDDRARQADACVERLARAQADWVLAAELPASGASHSARLRIYRRASVAQ